MTFKIIVLISLKLVVVKVINGLT